MNALLTKYKTTLVFLFLFGAAFGYTEASVVVYLRELYYPAGFDIPIILTFPYVFFGSISTLSPIPQKILLTEVFREAATIVILGTLGYITGKNWKEKLAFFLWPFGIWDIFYYIFLKIILDWPQSLATLDVLFLIPVPWIAPVWMPLLGAALFLTTSLILLSRTASCPA